MLAVSRFQTPGSAFGEEALRVIEFWRTCEGCVSAELLRNVDDDDLWAIVSRWESVGAYRRSFGGYEAKMILTPVLGRAIDEPSAYLSPEEAGSNIPRGMR